MADEASDAASNGRIVARQHLGAVTKAVLATGELDDPRWHSLAVVFSLSKAGRNFGNGGYAYGDGDDWWAVSFPVLCVRPAVLAYVHAVRDPLPETLTRVLFQYDRRSGKARLAAEFDHVERWAITPDSARETLQELRPRFEQLTSAVG